MADWFADDAFWEIFYPVLFPATRMDIAEEQIDKILALTRFEGRTVLDLACGRADTQLC